MGTNATVNPTVFPSHNDIAKVENRGSRGEEKQLREWSNALTLANFTVSGLTLATAGSLILPIAVGVGWIDGHRTEIEASTITLADDDTNHIYLQLTFDGSSRVDAVLLNANVTGVAPVNSVKIGQAVTAAGIITSVLEEKQIGPKTQSGQVLIEEKTFASDATTFTFTGLSGDTSKVYKLVGRVLLPAAGGPHLLRIEPNAVTTAQSGAGFRDDGVGITRFTAANMLLAQGDNGEVVNFEAIIHAEKTLNRVMDCTFSTDEPATGKAGSRWAETVTELTNILVRGDGGSKLRTGSQLILYELQQTGTI